MTSVVHIRKQDLQKVKKIGEGGYGSVFHMIWKRDDGDVHVAAKKQYEVEREELEVLSKLKHTNIVNLIGVIPEEIDFMLILELCEGGSLRHFLDSHGSKPLPKELFDRWAKEAARAIQYLQDIKIVHMDVKSENYLVSGDRVLKLADFGLAKTIEKTISGATQKGSWAYMAPELLKDGTLSPKKLDIYAYAVVLWEMLTGRAPYEGMEYLAIVWHVCDYNKRLEIPSDCPPYLADLMTKCWSLDHSTRPNIDEVIANLDNQRCCAGIWVLSSQFGHDGIEDESSPKLHQACGITIMSTSGDVAVNDIYTARVNVYNHAGRFKFCLGDDKREPVVGMFHKSPRDVAVDSVGNYFVTNESHYVQIYGSDGVFKHRFTVVSPEGQSCGTGTWLGGLAISNDFVYVGACKHTNFISKHSVSGGKHICTIPVQALPLYLGITALDTIVVSSWSPNVVLIVNQITGVVKTIVPPTCITQWRPTGICCGDDVIFVAIDNQSATDEYGVYCFSLAGDYIGCATNKVTNPTGIAVSDDGKTLMVAQYERGNPQEGCGLHGVKVFSRV